MPAKWRYALRADRRVLRPVLVLPPPTVVVSPPTSAADPVKPALLSRAWSIAKVVGPASVAVAALVLSVFAYTQQKEVDQAGQAASKSQQAEQVTFLQGFGTPPYDTVTVYNTSNAAVTDVRFFVVATVAANASAGLPHAKKLSFLISLGDIPGCDEGSPDVAQAVEELATSQVGVQLNQNEINFQITSMIFRDRNGNNWSEVPSGPPQPISSGEVYSDIAASFISQTFALPAAPQYRLSAGCT
jgi:hypothetical protein